MGFAPLVRWVCPGPRRWAGDHIGPLALGSVRVWCTDASVRPTGTDRSHPDRQHLDQRIVHAMTRPSDREVSDWLVSRRQQGRADQLDWLAGVEAHAVTALDVFEASARGEAPTLGGLKLRRLLRSMGHGQATTTRLLRRISDRTASAHGRVTREPSVGWLVDPKASGRRLAAWVDAVETPRTNPWGKSTPPWPGFPFHSLPDVPTVPASGVKRDEVVEPAAEPSPWDDFGVSTTADPWAGFGTKRERRVS